MRIRFVRQSRGVVRCDRWIRLIVAAGIARIIVPGGRCGDASAAARNHRVERVRFGQNRDRVMTEVVGRDQVKLIHRAMPRHGVWPPRLLRLTSIRVRGVRRAV